ncbi:hypothetical protein HK096_007979 [Nowakowskiella sp. JEL0078]|nr:hypothetical protein HK096_007979 [Nowakowskiella sp. JEL0078]
MIERSDSFSSLPANSKSANSNNQHESPHYTVVLKLGTSSICDEHTLYPRLSILSLLVETVKRLRELGHRVVIVSSGAVGVGLKRMNLSARPKHLAQVQAVAAVGQGRLMALYDSLFEQFDIPIAQRTSYLNGCNTFKELLDMGVVPIVNENDTVSTSEIRVGDNDTLSAITAGMANAQYLFLLTDVDCLYTDNPRRNPNAKVVRVVEDIAKLKEEISVSAPGSSLGTGGMVTKLIAADLATAAGCTTVISNGKYPDRVIELLNQASLHSRILETHKASGSVAPEPIFTPTVGTTFIAKPNPLDDRKWWIKNGLATYGTLYLDDGAVKAITGHIHSSLFAAGIVKVEGKFNAHQCVKLKYVVQRKIVIDNRTDIEEEEIEIGKGLSNYAFHEVQKLMGCKSSEIEELLGYRESEFIIHRSNLVVTSDKLDWKSLVNNHKKK